MKYFTTFSLLEHIDFDQLLETEYDHIPKYIYVLEHGKNGTNAHIHLYFETNKWANTTTVSKNFRKYYDQKFVDSLKSTRHLVVTKNVTSFEGVIQYMSKEQNGINDFKFKGFTDDFIRKHYKQLNKSTNKIQKELLPPVLTLIKAPYVLKDYFNMSSDITNETITKALRRLMMDDKYITHHLIQENNLDKIQNGLFSVIYKGNLNK